MDSGGPNEAQVQSHSPGSANVPSWKVTVVPLDEYDKNRFAVVMQHYVKLLWPLVAFMIFTIHYCNFLLTHNGCVAVL